MGNTAWIHEKKLKVGLHSSGNEPISSNLFVLIVTIRILYQFEWPRGVEEAGCKIYSGVPTVSQTMG